MRELEPIKLDRDYWLWSRWHPNWTEYIAAKLDEPGGRAIGGKIFRSCYKREALAWALAQIKEENEHDNNGSDGRS